MFSWTLFWIIVIVGLAAWTLWGMIRVSRNNNDDTPPEYYDCEPPVEPLVIRKEDECTTCVVQGSKVEVNPPSVEVLPELNEVVETPKVEEEKPKRSRKKAITGPASDATVTKKRRSKKK